MRRRPDPVGLAEADTELAATLDNLDDADRYADWIVSLIEPQVGHDVLEVGAGHGTITTRLAPGRHIVASDISVRCTDALARRFAGRSEVEVITADVHGATSGRSFDSVVLINVLEHIPDDRSALTDLYVGLRPGGTVIVYVPAFQGLYSEFDRRVGHVRRYRKATLCEALEHAGFEVESLRYVNAVGAVAWWVLARQLGRNPTTRGVVQLYDRLAVPVVRRLEDNRDPPFGQSLLAIARRPIP
jgi:SAM-dependent methyltransferase